MTTRAEIRRKLGIVTIESPSVANKELSEIEAKEYEEFMIRLVNSNQQIDEDIKTYCSRCRYYGTAESDKCDSIRQGCSYGVSCKFIDAAKCERYKKLDTNLDDPECIQITDKKQEGNIILSSSDELISITNNIRKEKGFTDMAGEPDSEVYYNFYLEFNAAEKYLKLAAVCEGGEQDDCAIYELPMSNGEQRNVMWQLIGMLSTGIYNL